ncbi:RNA polymerase sigma factor [Ferruginibacter lapsinanis]|uniref:RNA polymerase sigma factor n=1 Tax=Ferruginibacter lapsinanis TaxID=563172 RepID=UPI001E61AA81|nr:RNA polymerase sigma factor [Ferruginibacter lapsinanis]UEG49916.1 RNA polymerase sigma factor [Ferruginibacter lapsinanis]
MANDEYLVDSTDKLIQGCIRGDRYSQSQLYALYAPKMFIVCLRYSKNREEAEDIMQDGFTKVFSFIHQFKSEGSFEGWIRKIIVNCALQRYRNKPQLHAVIDINNNIVEHIGDEDILSKLGVKELLKMIQQLPPAYRMVFNLYVFEGMKHREIALKLGIAEGTSKSNLSDARTLLQKAVNNSLLTAKQNINSI